MSRQILGSARIRHHGRIGRGYKRVIEGFLVGTLVLIGSLSFATSAHAETGSGNVVTATTAKNTLIDVPVVPSGDTSPVTAISQPTDEATPEGTAVLDASGKGVNYTPPTGYTSATEHSVSFTVTTADSTVFSVYVTVVNLTVTNITAPKSHENQIFAVNIVALSNDPNGEKLTVTAPKPASHGQCLAPAQHDEVPPGYIRWNPDKNYYGPDSCGFEISDQAGNIADGTLSFNITQDIQPGVFWKNVKSATPGQADGASKVTVCNLNVNSQITYSTIVKAGPTLQGQPPKTKDYRLGYKQCQTKLYKGLKAGGYVVGARGDDKVNFYLEDATVGVNKNVVTVKANISKHVNSANQVVVKVNTDGGDAKARLRSVVGQEITKWGTILPNSHVSFDVTLNPGKQTVKVEMYRNGHWHLIASRTFVVH